jgi:hypothetical protein
MGSRCRRHRLTWWRPARPAHWSTCTSTSKPPWRYHPGSRAPSTRSRRLNSRNRSKATSWAGPVRAAVQGKGSAARRRRRGHVHFSGDGDLTPAHVVEAPWLRRLQTARGRLRRVGDGGRHRAHKWRDRALHSRHHRSRRGSRRTTRHDGELDLPRTAAGRRAVHIGREAELRDDRTVDPDGSAREGFN